MVESVEVKGVTVQINGEDQFFPEDALSSEEELTYGQIVDRVRDTLPQGPQVRYTVTYYNSAGRPRDGELREGESVKVQNGTGFNVDAVDLS